MNLYSVCMLHLEAFKVCEQLWDSESYTPDSPVILGSLVQFSTPFLESKCHLHDLLRNA